MILSSNSIVTPLLGIAALALFALNFSQYLEYRSSRAPEVILQSQIEHPFVFRWERHAPSFRIPPPAVRHFEFKSDSPSTFKLDRRRQLEMERRLSETNAATTAPNVPPNQSI